MEANKLDASLTDDGRYRLLVEAVTDYAIYMLDPNGIVASWNPGAQRIKGYLADEIIGQHFSRFYTEEDRNSGLPARALETARRTGKFETKAGASARMAPGSGRRLIDPILTSRRGILSAMPRSPATSPSEASRADAQAQRRAVPAAGAGRHRLRHLHARSRRQRSPTGTSAHNASRATGRRKSSASISHNFIRTKIGAAGEPRRALETAKREGKFEKEAWRVRKDGSRFWAHVVIDPLRDETGALLGFAKITRDITERREAQLKLDKTREALAQSQKMEAIGHLTGGIAHDFNNLLMAISSSLELIRKRLPPDPKLQRLLDNAMQGAERGAVLTKRMLAFARRQELSTQTIQIPDLVRGMSDMLERSLGPSISIETRFPLKLSAISADANQLEMAILNLAVNSRDAMPEGGRIIIAAEEEEVRATNAGNLKPGQYVRLSVTDTGEGMNAETLRRATEPFFTTKGVGKGTGLGVPMVHGLAEQFGGRFELRSRIGEGTTAEIWLPAAETIPVPAPAGSKSPAKERFYEPLVILCVDDDPLVLINTVAMLEDIGHTVLAASSGRQALNFLREDNSIDLVITDQIMPGMTGVRARSRNPD